MRRQLSLFLMIFSLALLGIFLLLFLRKIYLEEKEGLRRETGLLFINTMRGIESAAIDQLLIRNWEGRSGGDSMFNMKIRMTDGLLSPDTSRAVFFSQKKTDTLRIQRGGAKVYIGKQVERSSLAGALSMSVVVRGNNGDSVCLFPAGKNITPRLEEGFAQALEKSGLPLRFSIDTSGATFEKSATFFSGRYVDIGSGITYQAEIQEYNAYILKKILPQLLFAILLYTLVGLAFLFIYQSLRRQQHLTELKNDFIRNITHELKTPIATVSVAVEAMQNFDALQDPKRTKEYLEISRLELNRLSLLVDKVLRMSQFEKEAFELKLEPVNLKNLVEEIMASMKLQFEKYNAAVLFKSSESDFSFTGDRLHLASVVYNLLDNALKYSPVRPEIAVNLEQHNGHFTLSVSDKGRGIPEAFRGKIFDKFFRVPTGDVHNVKGHGLGLSYVAGVVKTHGGDIGVESREGLGSTFTIRLPV